MGARRAVWLIGLGLTALAAASGLDEVAAQADPAQAGAGASSGLALDADQAEPAPRRRSVMPVFDYDAALVRMQLRSGERVEGRPADLLRTETDAARLPAAAGIPTAEAAGQAPISASTAPPAAPEPARHVQAAVPVPTSPVAQAGPAAATITTPAAPSSPEPAVADPLPAVAAAPEDPFAAAMAARLADGRGLWPARLPKRERDAVAAFYAARGGRPIWIADRAWSPAAGAVIASLGRAGEDALDPADYPTPRLGPGARVDREADLAEAELKLSAAAILYARDARGGRIEPSRLSALITPKLDLPGAEAVLALLSTASDSGAALERYNPAYPGYRALKAKLAELRAHRPSQPMARAPRRQAAVTQVIAALDDVPPAPIGLYGDPRLEGDIAANMERWRWLPAEVASRYIFVNVPEFRLRLMEDGRVAHETRVITGKPESPTPLFSGAMEYAIVNPSWYIPPSIMKKEILPGLAADPSYAARRGYEVIRRGNQISVRQPPGERNALGFIKFMFPNQHAVYLHDTPNRNLFSASRRAFSHGCVRVENPFQLADFVLGHDWSEQRLKKLIGRGERTIRTPQPLPVHLAYFTTTVDEFGEIRSYEDIYGYNRRVRAALGFGG